MKKMRLGIITMLCSVVMLAGCGNAIPELTEEQYDLVVEYAAGTLLKYDKNNENRLIELSELEEAERAAIAKAAVQESASQAEESEKQAGEQAEDVKLIDNTQPQEPIYASIEEFLQLEQVTFKYTGCEIADEYPNHEQGEEFFFVMSATEGKKLLVLKFQVDNTSGADVELNMNQLGTRFKIAVDGEERNALTTMLLNDMTYYQGTIAAGESTELVLVIEIPAERAQGITTMELIMKNVDNTATISLN